MIYIVNYGAGNMRSICRSIEYLNFEYKVIKSLSKIGNDSIILIPGVGSFNTSAINLKKGGFNKIASMDLRKRPFIIGICLGMQLLFTKGYEGGESEGLNLIKGNVKKIPRLNNNINKINATLIGWETYKAESSLTIPKWIKEYENSSFYHIHSYMCIPDEKKFIYATYPGELSFIPTIVGSTEDKVYGFQFHPEKSGDKGLSLLNDAINEAYEALRC